MAPAHHPRPTGAGMGCGLRRQAVFRPAHKYLRTVYLAQPMRLVVAIIPLQAVAALFRLILIPSHIHRLQPTGIAVVPDRFALETIQPPTPSAAIDTKL